MSSIAWWSHTSNKKVASARLRCFQVVDELKRQGFDVGTYAPGQKAPAVLVLSKRYDAESVRHALTLRRDAGTKIVLDLCDNYLYYTNDEPKWQTRAAHLRDAVAAVDKVIASTPTLRDCIEQACPKRPEIAVVGDAVELPGHPTASYRPSALKAEYRLARLRRAIERARIESGRRLLWFGSHGSGHAEGGMGDLLLIRNCLERANANKPLSLTIISNSESKYQQLSEAWGFQTHYLKWHLRTFSRAASLHDIAVIPIGKNPFTLCKTNNRVATAFMHRLAVVADSIPSYEDFADTAVLDDWEQGLDRLMGDSGGRQARIERGLSLVEQHWSLSSIVGQWKCALNLV